MMLPYVDASFFKPPLPAAAIALLFCHFAITLIDAFSLIFLRYAIFTLRAFFADAYR